MINIYTTREFETVETTFDLIKKTLGSIISDSHVIF